MRHQYFVTCTSLVLYYNSESCESSVGIVTRTYLGHYINNNESRESSVGVVTCASLGLYINNNEPCESHRSVTCA